MKSLHIAVSLTLASLILPACGHKKSKNKAPAPVVMFVHGDPKQLLAGSTQDKQSFLTTANYKTFDGFHFAGAAYFIEKEEQYNPKDFNEVEDNNSTDDDDTTAAPPIYSFKQVGNRYIYTPNNVKYPTVGFVEKNGALELSDLGGSALAIEHYSLKKDGRAFSILGSFVDSTQGRGLFELTFADSSKIVKLTETAEDMNYNYLSGHKPVKWEESISLDLCGQAVPQNQQNSVKASLEAWYKEPNRAADETVRGVTYSVKTQFPPFSDLNSHCLYLTSKFKAENSTNFYVAGVTLPSVNYASNELIDSDVFIFMDHVSRELNAGNASPTTTHEIGHFFGLGHEFKDPDQGHEHYLSIMGYSDGTDAPTDGDFKAIRNLYKTGLGDQAALVAH